MSVELETLVSDFAQGIIAADKRAPQAVNARSKVAFQPGIGPHSEEQTTRLVIDELRVLAPERYRASALGVPYSGGSRQKCDLCIGQDPTWEWATEIKMLRFLGDNGKENSSILMHILSPYPADRSALIPIRSNRVAKLWEDDGAGGIAAERPIMCLADVSHLVTAATWQPRCPTRPSRPRA
jgi:hypothetical protein